MKKLYNLFPLAELVVIHQVPDNLRIGKAEGIGHIYKVLRLDLVEAYQEPTDIELLSWHSCIIFRKVC